MDIYHQCAANKPSVTLLEGPPGSGKSVVIANLVEQLRCGPDTSFKNLKILICTQSNGAADNIAAKLIQKQGMDGLKQLRYGIDEKIGAEARPVSLKQYLAAQFDKHIDKLPLVKSLFDRKKLLVGEIERLSNSKQSKNNWQHDQMCNLENMLAELTSQINVHEKSLWAKVDKSTPYLIQSSTVITSTLGFVHNLKK
jgi:senataxin